MGEGSGSATNDNTHALLWNGSADSYVDLNPSGFTESIASATNGVQQVGTGWRPEFGLTSGTSENFHALLWNSAADSFVDLHPSGFARSYGFGIGGTQQVGYAELAGGADHAVLWSGSAAGSIDLNPGGFGDSCALATDGTRQVGYGDGSVTGWSGHALLWSGSAANCVDLGALLPTSFTRSYAESIDGGTIDGVALDTSGAWHAIEWSVPEPGSVGLVGLAMLACARRRRMRR